MLGPFKHALRQSSIWQRQVKILGDALRSIHPSMGLDPAQDLLGAAERVLDSVSGYLTLGNKIVFAELGTIFAKFIRAFEGDTSPDQTKLASFLEQFPDGPPEPDEVTRDPETGAFSGVERGGKTLLKQSMANYYEALFTRDAKKKAELILFANAQGGLHEQTRLQTYIAGSLNAAGNDLLYNTQRDALVQKLGDKTLLAPLRLLLDRLLKPISVDFEKIFRQFSTREMMKLKLPDRELELGKGVPAAPGQPLLPPALATIANPDLRSVLAHYEALGEESGQKMGILEQATATVGGLLGDLGLAPERAVGSAARDWGDLHQRMRYIFQLFRVRAQDDNLFGQPFSAAQRGALMNDEIPDGPLY